MKLVDVETGQIFEDVKSIITEKQAEGYKNHTKMSEEKKKFVDEYGNFIFKANHDKSKNVDFTIGDSDIAKLIYCATYLNYDNIITWDSGKPMSKSELKEVVGVSERLFYKWYNKMINSMIMSECEKSIKISKDYCIKGKLNKSNQYNLIFSKAIRNIYEENIGKNLKTLGLVMRMLPSVNRANNMLCWNPSEMNEELIHNMTVKELMEISGVKDLRMVKQFMNQTQRINVYDGEPVVLFVNSGGNMSNGCMMFNPRLSYSGKRSDIGMIYKIFTSMSRKNKRFKGNKKSNKTLKK